MLLLSLMRKLLECGNLFPFSPKQLVARQPANKLAKPKREQVPALHIFLLLATLTHANPELQKQAEAGDTEAQVKLGIAYRDGKGVPLDPERAVEWFRKSAAQGNPRGQDNLGFMLLRGTGVEQDQEAALRWFRKSADQGNHWGLNNLGNCYERAEGVPRDPEQAVKLWEQALAAGSDYAAISLAQRWLPGCSETPDWKRARAWLEKGAAINGQKSSSLLAHMLWHGLAGKTDREEALAIWEKSGDPSALQYHRELLEKQNQPGRFANIPLEHLHQGYNLCGPTACAMAAAAWGKPIHPFEIKRQCPNSPFGTGTDWNAILTVLKKQGLSVELHTWPDTDAGFDTGMKALRSDLDAGRVVIVDVIWPENEATLSGHTMLATGYDEENRILILHDPAQPPPGIRLMTYDEWKAIWHSRWYSRTSPGRARPVMRLIPKKG
jgi:uncharacterized protein